MAGLLVTGDPNEDSIYPFFLDLELIVKGSDEAMHRTVDRQVAGGCIRPSTLVAALAMTRPAPNRLLRGVQLGIGGLILEPLAWMQSLIWGRALQRNDLSDDPVIVIGHWRSGTTYLHQLLAAKGSAASN